MNETASWSSNSGWLGGWPAAPKLSGVGTRPRPNRCSQTRLTSTRAVSGFSGEASHSASSSRPLPCSIVGRLPAHDLHHAPRHDLARLFELATLVEGTVARLGPVEHAHGVAAWVSRRPRRMRAGSRTCASGSPSRMIGRTRNALPVFLCGSYALRSCLDLALELLPRRRRSAVTRPAG